MRYNLADIGGVAETVVGYGMHAPASPHDEDWIPPFFGCGFPGNHAVRSMEDVYGGGFVSARSKLIGDWVNTSHGHYTPGEPMNWGNTEAKLQCDGEWVWSDGKVYILDTPGGAGDSSPGFRGFGI
jgi:hypothetical protein